MDDTILIRYTHVAHQLGTFIRVRRVSIISIRMHLKCRVGADVRQRPTWHRMGIRRKNVCVCDHCAIARAGHISCVRAASVNTLSTFQIECSGCICLSLSASCVAVTSRYTAIRHGNLDPKKGVNCGFVRLCSCSPVPAPNAVLTQNGA